MFGKSSFVAWLTILVIFSAGFHPAIFGAEGASGSSVIRSATNGPWSDAATWEGGKMPGPGARVLIRPGHTVTYDVKSDAAVRAVQIGGTLTFARDRDTLLCAGLVWIAPGEAFMENGFDCEAHQPKR